MTNYRKYIGLIPAAGFATRLTNLSCSKEILPITYTDKDMQVHEFPVCKVLIDAYKYAKIEQICIISREEKKDIKETLGDGKKYDVKLSYIYTQKTQGAAFTLDKAYSHTKNNNVALGFPDIIFKPNNAFPQLLNKHKANNADVVLGLFPAEKPEKMDMIELDSSNSIRRIHIKPKTTSLKWTWILAVWSPSFSEFMHNTLAALTAHQPEGQIAEMHVGRIFQLAIDEGLQFDSIFFDTGRLIDIGTADDLSCLSSRLDNEDWF